MTINPVTENVPLMSPRDFTMAIVGEVAREHNVTVKDILGPRRFKRIVAARHEAIKRVHAARPHWSTPDLGHFFSRDHTTILSALGGKRIHAVPAGVVESVE